MLACSRRSSDSTMLDRRVSTYLTATRFAQIAPGLHERHGLTARRGLLAGTRFVNQIAQLLRELAMAATRFIRGRLHGNCVKLLVVAFEMALKKGDKMGCRGHGYITIPAVPTDFMTNIRAVLATARP